MRVSKENHTKLSKLAKYGESLNDVLTRLLSQERKK